MATQIRELVLGGDGLIGSELGHLLRNRGHEVTSLDLRSGCDLRDVAPNVYEEFDRVWFLAWDTGGAKYLVAADRQHQQFLHNSELCARVFDALAVTGKPFLFVTSQLAGQSSPYGLTKLMAEKWAAELGGKVARLWNVYGWERPDIRSHVITDLVLSGLKEGRVRCRTDGQEHRRFLYKSDCVAALASLFDGPVMSADIAGGQWLSIKQVAEMVATLLGVSTGFTKTPGYELIAEPSNPLPGWKPTVELREGITAMIAEARQYLKKSVALVH